MIYKTGGCSVSTYDRKITKIGNSYGITFPKELLKEAKISYGDKVSVELMERKITREKEEDITLPEGVDHDLMKLLSDVIQEHDTACKGLVDKQMANPSEKVVYLTANQVITINTMQIEIYSPGELIRVKSPD